MDNKALIPVTQELSLEETIKLGDILFRSGFFSDLKQGAQAVVKILAGREMGVGPVASMTGIRLIKGSVAPGANIMATVVKADPRYDYRVVELTNERCEIVFFENGKDIGHSIFTIQDAQQAEVGKLIAPGASKTMLARFPRNILFSRAMSNGMRWYCPDATGGAPVYTPDELDEAIEPELDEWLTDDDLFDHKLDVAASPIVERESGDDSPVPADVNPDLEALSFNGEDSFHDVVMQEFPCYTHKKHIINYLTQKLGLNWGANYTKTALFEMLREHATEKEATQAATESGDEPSGETMQWEIDGIPA